MRDNNIQNRHTGKAKLSPYRKRLFKALNQVDPDALHNVTAYYDLTKYNFSNVWDAVLYLENDKQLVDDFDKIQRFADLLGTIASNTLIDLPSTTVEQFQTQFQKQTSDKQKTKLLKPESDIAARELDFQKAYNEALKDGSVPVNLGMLKVIGQEGVGKTCLINACLGKEFEEKHVVTDGIAVIRTASTTWTEAKADSGNPSKQYAKIVTDKLREKKNVNIDMRPPIDDNDDNNDDYKTDDNNDDNNDGAYTVTEAIPFDTEQQLDKDAIKNVVEENKEETFEETFNIYDHGGQLIYHGIHRIFMTSRSLYIVVFDLSKPLDDLATFIDSSGEKCKHHWTNLQLILSYILSVYSHSRIVEEDKGKGVHKPTILIVGTHKGKLGKTEKNQKSEVNTQCNQEYIACL
ncbi:uncharacterized protein [Antedon mediterranea]|uniref:uncharacterized protein n=1 Tax=Antedon mediterranea TaxID=105859 RepID=UPI003AF51AB7